MRVLVAGGAGFIGSHVVDAVLAAGHQAFVIDNLSSGRPDNLPAGVQLFPIDVSDGAAVARVFDEVQPDWVCHQAAQISVSRSVREPSFDANINVLGLLHLLESAVRVKTRKFVFASSGGVLYGDIAEPCDEQTTARPISPYGISKWVGEKYLEFFSREHGLQTVALRYANVYGPRQNPHGEAGVVAIFCERLLSGQSLRINGDGRHDRDFVFGLDVARANLLALETSLSTGFEPFNIGTGTKTDISHLEAGLRVAMDNQLKRKGRSGVTSPPVEHGPERAGDLRSSVLDCRKAAKLLGWRAEILPPRGFELTAEWYASQLS